MVDVPFVTLLVIHLGSIVAWMGAAALFVLVIAPSLGTMSPGARGEFVTSTLPRYFQFIQGSSLTAVSAGLGLYGYIILSNRALGDSNQVSLQAGIGVALVALIVLYGMGLPAGRKMVALVKQMGKTPSADLAGQVAVQQRKASIAAKVGVGLLAITLVLMILSREL